uniref:DUF4398 domain-containing protein n=1 Tax=Pseudoxanthomonas koreensis TaxID=266061 RepID=UPI00403EE8DD
MAATLMDAAFPMNEPSFAQFRVCLYALALAFALPAMALAQALPEVQQAEQAILQAQQADADHYAPDLLEGARQTLVQAQLAAASRSRSERRQAPALAARAAVDADLARVRSEQASIETGLLQRRNEIAELNRRLGQHGEGAP